jgi:hypothetical protein
MARVIVRDRRGVSIRALMISVALFALILAPIVWMYHRAEAERLQAIMAAAEAARAQAEIAARFVSQSAYDNPSATSPRQNTTVSPASSSTSLWAALAVNHPIFERGRTKDLTIEFTLVNDGDTAIDPRIAESTIVINDNDLADSGEILGGGPKDARFQSLPAGAHLQLSFPLGDHFHEPGIYRVSWKGARFQSPEVFVRVVREKAD